MCELEHVGLEARSTSRSTVAVDLGTGHQTHFFCCSHHPTRQHPQLQQQCLAVRDLLVCHPHYRGCGSILASTLVPGAKLSLNLAFSTLTSATCPPSITHPAPMLGSSAHMSAARGCTRQCHCLIKASLFSSRVLIEARRMITNLVPETFDVPSSGCFVDNTNSSLIESISLFESLSSVLRLISDRMVSCTVTVRFQSSSALSGLGFAFASRSGSAPVVSVLCCLFSVVQLEPTTLSLNLI